MQSFRLWARVLAEQHLIMGQNGLTGLGEGVAHMSRESSVERDIKSAIVCTACGRYQGSALSKRGRVTAGWESTLGPEAQTHPHPHGGR